MAVAAIGRTCDMRRRTLARVAGTAISGDLAMLKGLYRRPRLGVMALFAGVRRRHMTNRFAAHADVVMAGFAVAGDAGVIEGNDQPCRGAGMAGVTFRNGWNMCGRFADFTNMAGAAYTEGLGVIDARHLPRATGGVTCLAKITGVVMRRGFSLGAHTIMTTHAGTGVHQCVIKLGG